MSLGGESIHGLSTPWSFSSSQAVIGSLATVVFTTNMDAAGLELFATALKAYGTVRRKKGRGAGRQDTMMTGYKNPGTARTESA